MDSSECLRVILDCAKRRRLAQINYEKPSDDHPSERWVEPYELQESAGGAMMISCWQIRPTIIGEAWRHFRVDRIISACDGGDGFEPRRKITADTGEIFKFIYKPPNHAGPMTIVSSRPQPNEITPSWEYRIHLEAALNGQLMPDGELENIRTLGSILSKDEKRAVHALIYAGALAEAAGDGKIDDYEDASLCDISNTLHALGWRAP